MEIPYFDVPQHYEEKADMLERHGIDSQYLCCLNCVFFSDRCNVEATDDNCGTGKHLWAMAMEI